MVLIKLRHRVYCVVILLKQRTLEGLPPDLYIIIYLPQKPFPQKHSYAPLVRFLHVPRFLHGLFSSHIAMY